MNDAFSMAPIDEDIVYLKFLKRVTMRNLMTMRVTMRNLMTKKAAMRNLMTKKGAAMMTILLSQY
jgi:hypothetical protein